MSVVFAIDPGPVRTAWVAYDASAEKLLAFDTQPNEHVLDEVRFIGDYIYQVDHIAIEKIESFGMSVGAEIFETVFFSGQLAEAAARAKVPVARIGRLKVKMAVCHDSRAKDSNIRQALIDRFGGSTAIGLKRSPGPLYGVAGDEWAALAVAVTWADQHA